MPWKVERTEQCPASKPWGVIKISDGKVVSCHATQESAKQQLAALYANEPKGVKMTTLNGVGVSNANAKIASGAVDKSSDWSFSGADGNALLGPGGDDWANYSKWHLGTDGSAKPDTKAHYKYPFGKGGKVYRSGIIAAKQRAAQQGETAIEDSAAHMLDKIDGKAAEPVLHRAWAVLEVKSMADNPDGEMEIEGIASSPATDRMGDVVEPMGAQYALPMPLLYQHNSRMPIGRVHTMAPTPKGIPFKATVAKKGVADWIDEARSLIRNNLLRGVSIGFRSLDSEPLDPKDPYGGQRFKQWECMELSCVTIPANADASIQAIRSYDLEHGCPAPLPAPGPKEEKAPVTGVVRLSDRPGASGLKHPRR